ncbi:hypothetical protein SIID45300_01038 [Candidatus Magnetaquicoccaceae bacterium FCR-1]|uniref:Secreted protein n=1 Tax=Candidatus Magnetaquiglobus chichijimensis TaxID=3141448 RepID=A0ABQ0C772_9PROT
MSIFDLITTVAPPVIATASAIAAITPTPQQGSTLWYAYRLIDFLALNVNNAKDPGEPPCRR